MSGGGLAAAAVRVFAHAPGRAPHPQGDPLPGLEHAGLAQLNTASSTPSAWRISVRRSGVSGGRRRRTPCSLPRPGGQRERGAPSLMSCQISAMSASRPGGSSR